MNIQTEVTPTGHVTIEQWNGQEWKYLYENHNVVVNGYKNLLAQQLAGSISGVVASQMAAGTTNTSFSATSTALGAEVGRTTALTNSSINRVTTAVGIVLFGGSHTIREIGLYYGTTALAFANITALVTSLSPLRISWDITHS